MKRGIVRDIVAAVSFDQVVSFDSIPFLCMQGHYLVRRRILPSQPTQKLHASLCCCCYYYCCCCRHAAYDKRHVQKEDRSAVNLRFRTAPLFLHARLFYWRFRQGHAISSRHAVSSAMSDFSRMKITYSFPSVSWKFNCLRVGPGVVALWQAPWRGAFFLMVEGTIVTLLC